VIHRFKFLLLTLGTLLLSGCFEVIEEVTYKSTESGTYLMTVNCSKSRTRLNALMKLDTFMGVNIPSTYEVSDYFRKAHAAVSKVPGISKSDYTTDYQNYIFTFTFTFDKTETMNKAINAAAQSVTQKSALPYYNVFAFKQNTFQRHKTPNDSLAKIAKVRKGQLQLISGARATSIYRFTQPVAKTSNSKAILSKDRKAVMLKQDITDILLNPSLFANTITVQ
jgi:hypothetical protein